MSRFVAVWAALAFSGVLVFGVPSAEVLAASPSPVPPSPVPTPFNECLNTSTGFTPLTDLGPRTYQGEQGGLYPGGSNLPSGGYKTAGMQAAGAVVPRDDAGNPSPNGKIVFLSIGMSNTSLEFSAFAKYELADGSRNPAVVMVDGAQFGIDATGWTSPTASPWGVIDQRLAAAGVTRQQVEVVWLKQALANPSSPFQTYAHQLQQDLSLISSNAANRYPNLRQEFVSARTYGGYSGIYPTTPTRGPNPEPWAYQTGWAVKWFVAQSVANPVQRPWVSWSPYFWTDGTRGRADGLKWYCSDTFDGTHPNNAGLAKTTSLMHSLFVSSVFTPWFTGTTPVQVASPSPAPGATPPPGSVQRPGATPSPASATGSPAQTIGTNRPPTSGLPTPISSILTFARQREDPLLLFAVLLVAASLAGITYLLMARRRAIRRRLVKPGPTAGGQNGSGPGPPTDVGKQAAEPPALVGVAPANRGPDEGSSPPAK